MSANLLGLTPDQWLDLGLSALIVVAALVVGRWAILLILQRVVGRVTGRTRTTLDDALLDAVHPPLYWLVVAVALDIALSRLDFLPAGWDAPLDDVFFVAYLGVGFAIAWRVVVALFDWYGEAMSTGTRVDMSISEQLMPFFRRLALIVLSVIVLVALLGHFEVNVSALVTTLGIGSLAIALAAQAALEDTISGFIIMIDRPFRIGDRIEILDLDTWGDVVDIGLRSSRIRTRDNRTVIVPNSVIGRSLIVNHSYPDSVYRIQVHVGVAYGTELEHARRTIIEAVRGVEGVMLDRPIEALFLEFGDSALIFRVRWWINSYVDTRRMFDKVNTAIYKALNKAGIVIPFPQREVWHRLAPQEAVPIADALRGNDPPEHSEAVEDEAQ